MDEEETVAAPASRIRFAPLARDKVGWRGLMGWRTICWLSPTFKVNSCQKCRADVSFAEGFRRGGERNSERGWESVHLWAHYQSWLFEAQHAPRNFGYCSKFRGFLAAFSCFFQLGKWARRKKKQRNGKAKAVTKLFSLLFSFVVVVVVVVVLDSVAVCKNPGQEVRFEPDFDSGCKGQSKGEGQGFCRRWEISSLTANRSRDVGIMSSLVAPLNFTGSTKKWDARPFVSSVIRDCYSPSWESWNFFLWTYTVSRRQQRIPSSRTEGNDPKPDRRGEDSGAVWHPSSPFAVAWHIVFLNALR